MEDGTGSGQGNVSRCRNISLFYELCVCLCVCQCVIVCICVCVCECICVSEEKGNRTEEGFIEAVCLFSLSLSKLLLALTLSLRVGVES